MRIKFGRVPRADIVDREAGTRGFLNTSRLPVTYSALDEPYQRGCQGKFFPFLSEGDGRCGLHPAHLSFGGAVGLPRIPD
jgi:hypothetical protein